MASNKSPYDRISMIAETLTQELLTAFNYFRLNRLSELHRNEICEFPETGDECPVEEFFSMIDKMGQNIDEIEQLLNEIAKVQDDIILKPATAHKSLKERHDKLKEEIIQLLLKVHGGLKRLDEELKRDEVGPNRHSANFRIKQFQYAILSHKLTKHVVLEYYRLEEKYQEQCKNVLKRQLQTIYPSREISDKEVEELLESQGHAQDILTQTVQNDHALHEVEARKREIIHLEENIKELHDMFYNILMADITSRGDHIDDLADNVEHYVKIAPIFVAKETVRASVYTHRNRRIRTWWRRCFWCFK